MIILCNPNNPTGNVMPLIDIRKIAERAECPVVIDEAYQEFYGETALELVQQYPNVVVVRTLKAYGLASARVGYAIASGEYCENC